MSHVTWTWLPVWLGSGKQFRRKLSSEWGLYSPPSKRYNDASCFWWAAHWLLGGSDASPPGVPQRARWYPWDCEAVFWHVSLGCPTNVQLRKGLGTSLSMGESWIFEIAGDLGQHVQDGLLYCRLERWMHSHADGRRAQQQTRWHCLCSRAQWHAPGKCAVLSSQSWWSLPQPWHSHLHSGRVQSRLEAGNAPQFDSKLVAAHHENRDFVNFVSWTWPFRAEADVTCLTEHCFVVN